MSTAVAVGDNLGPLTVGPLSEETLRGFAAASGDDNPVHLDPDAAARAGLDGVIAHGMLGMAYLGRVVTGWRPGARMVSFKARFTAPMPRGAGLVCAGRVSSVDDSGRAKVVLTAKLDDGTTAIRGEAVVDVSGHSPR